MEEVKFNYIKEDDFILYIDWLTRFKNPINNILRVSEKIITKNCIYPKFSSKTADKLSFLHKVKIAQFIWNKSIEKLLGTLTILDNNLQEFLLYEESKTFNEDFLKKQIINIEYDEQLFEKTDYQALRKSISFELNALVNYFENKGIKKKFLERLYLKKNSKLLPQDLFYAKDDFASIKKLFIVEGITEEKLFPLFAKQCGLDFEKEGIKLYAAGGKTHILKYYSEIKNLLNIPIVILLDADGQDIINTLNNMLLKKDYVYLISTGEIEDILSQKLIVRSINNFYHLEASICEYDLNKDEPMTKILHNLFREKGYGEFHKAKFAQLLSENIESEADVSDEIKKILTIIFK